eukprot:Gb_34391 [translate_table: standard]
MSGDSGDALYLHLQGKQDGQGHYMNACFYRIEQANLISHIKTVSLGRMNLQRNQGLQLSNKYKYENNSEVPYNIRPTLTEATLILAIYLGVGTICFSSLRHELKGIKTNSVVDALYFCMVTLTTVGYGDLVPTGTLPKLFVCGFVFAGMVLMSLFLSSAADYLIEIQEKLLIKSLKKHGFDQSISIENQTNSKTKWKLLITLAILLVLMGIGMVVLHEVEGLNFLDSFYCVCSTISTLGYGDKSFSTEGGRIFAVIWILVSTVCLAHFFLYIAEMRTEHMQWAWVYCVLGRRTTISDLEKADMDHDGAVSAAEFIIYKLKEMGKIEEQDAALVMKEFERRDVDKSRTLTESDLRLSQPA